MVTCDRIKWVLAHKIKPHLQKRETAAFVLETDGSGLIYRHLNGENVATIIKFSNEDELFNILEELQREQMEYRNGIIQKVKQNTRQERGRRQPKDRGLKLDGIRSYNTRNNLPLPFIN